MTLINAVYVVNKSTRPYSSVVSNDVYKGKRKKFINLVLICPIAIIPVLVKSALFVSYFFSGYFSVSASTMARAFTTPSSPSLMTMEIASAI